MKTRFSPSVNIIRDEASEVEYIVTHNARRVAGEIANLYKKGFHNFSIIGSYGSGKSSFLWAFEKDLKGEKKFFNLDLTKEFDFIKFVGEYASLHEKLAERFNTSLEIFEIFESIKSDKRRRILLIDEFGKFIEYAVRNEPEREIYFLQQLAEFIADPENNCLLITTLHQSFDAYSGSFLDASERNEWRKVKGRFKDLTFNEPVEQLLYLAAQKIGNDKGDLKTVQKNLDLQKEYSIIRSENKFLQEIGKPLWPLDVFSAYILAVGLQRYGQNERSLFTFLEGDFDEKGTKQIIIADIYDYLQHEFFSYLRSDKNYDYNGWRSVAVGLERVETLFKGNTDLAQIIIKIVGLVTLLGHKGARLNQQFFIQYLSDYTTKEIEKALQELESKKIILFTKYNNAYRIIEGTDVDFAEELKAADREVDDYIDAVTKLKEHFQFSVINAKSITYQLGTPRFFEYVISENPLQKTPVDQIDGFINLIFNEELKFDELKNISKEQVETIFACFNNTHDIRELLIDIERTNKAKERNIEDTEARKEFDNILKSQKLLLNRNVIDALFTEQVTWVYAGKKIKVTSAKELNKMTSEVSRSVYYKTPEFKNELVNRHVLVGAVGAKKPYFKALVDNYHAEDLGFSKEKFPAEKTIYLTILAETGIHIKGDSSYTFQQPKNSFKQLWETCEAFLESSKKERKKISALIDLLNRKPFKLTPGFLEFWIPTFLFIKRDDFALFSKDEGYQSDITESHLHAFTRTPEDFEIKAFDVDGVKLDLYNKYRELLHLKDEKKVNNQSLIESVKPFMVFYHHLNEYAKNTKRISSEARDLRVAIKNAQDPEKLFFEELPKATNTDLKDLLKDQNLFRDYIKKIREAIRELQTCYDHLVDRIELFTVQELLGEKELDFPAYKERIEKRFSNLKEHMLIPKQSGLLVRLRTPLNDRESWINSICHVIIGKKLDLIIDKEEDIFKEKLRKEFQGLDNMTKLTKESKNGKEKVLKIDISSLEEGTSEQVIRYPDELDDEALDTMNNVKKALGKNKNLNKFILVNLLKQQLDD